MRQVTGRAVRWKQGSRWHYGHLGSPNAIESDGSLRVYDDSNDAARSLPVSELEEAIRGPRGGRNWSPVRDLDLVLLTGDEVRQDGW